MSAPSLGHNGRNYAGQVGVILININRIINVRRKMGQTDGRTDRHQFVALCLPLRQPDIEFGHFKRLLKAFLF